MCRLFALSSRDPVSPMRAIEALNVMKEGHDGSGVGLFLHDLGGPFGRVIHFSNGDFSVHCRKINAGGSSKLVVRDRECWQQAIERQNRSQPAIDLW